VTQDTTVCWVPKLQHQLMVLLVICAHAEDTVLWDHQDQLIVLLEPSTILQEEKLRLIVLLALRDTTVQALPIHILPDLAQPDIIVFPMTLSRPQRHVSLQQLLAIFPLRAPRQKSHALQERTQLKPQKQTIVILVRGVTIAQLLVLQLVMRIHAPLVRTVQKEVFSQLDAQKEPMELVYVFTMRPNV